MFEDKDTKLYIFLKKAKSKVMIGKDGRVCVLVSVTANGNVSVIFLCDWSVIY